MHITEIADHLKSEELAQLAIIGLDTQPSEFPEAAKKGWLQYWFTKKAEKTSVGVEGSDYFQVQRG